MIKVQPASSRIAWSQSPERITLTMPPQGFWGVAGGLLFLSLAWLGFAGYLLIAALLRRSTEFSIVAGVLAIPGLTLLLACVFKARHTWAMERDALWLTFRRQGLFGTRVQRWPATDVASLYVQEGLHRKDWEVPWVLWIGFRNGRSAEVLHSSHGEELWWMAAMLSDPRGDRKAASPLILAAEPDRRRADPSIVPTTLACRSFEGGIEVSFLPLLRSRGLWWRVPMAALLGTVAIIAVAVLLHHSTRGAFPTAVPRIAIAALLGGTGWRLWVLQRWAVVQVVDGQVTIRRNQGKEPIQFGVPEVEFVQTYRVNGHTELQFLLRDKPKVRLLEGRPGQELEWAARFLRVAIKGRTAVPENAPMKVDAAAGDCQVCHEKMDSRVVYCGKCRTPHHEECWSYMGQCSTYGCREIRFERS